MQHQLVCIPDFCLTLVRNLFITNGGCISVKTRCPMTPATSQLNQTTSFVFIVLIQRSLVACNTHCFILLVFLFHSLSELINYNKNPSKFKTVSTVLCSKKKKKKRESTASHSVRLYLNTVLVHVHYDEAKVLMFSR